VFYRFSPNPYPRFGSTTLSLIFILGSIRATQTMAAHATLMHTFIPFNTSLESDGQEQVRRGREALTLPAQATPALFPVRGQGGGSSQTLRAYISSFSGIPFLDRSARAVWIVSGSAILTQLRPSLRTLRRFRIEFLPPSHCPMSKMEVGERGGGNALLGQEGMTYDPRKVAVRVFDPPIYAEPTPTPGQGLFRLKYASEQVVEGSLHPLRPDVLLVEFGSEAHVVNMG